MLYETVQEMYREAEESGMRRGIQDGIQKRQVQTLLTVLKTKFGLEDEKIRTRLENCDSQTLHTYVQRLLVIESLDDLFDDITQH